MVFNINKKIIDVRLNTASLRKLIVCIVIRLVIKHLRFRLKSIHLIILINPQFKKLGDFKIFINAGGKCPVRNGLPAGRQAR